MPRYKKREFQLDKYFLGKQSRSPAWCRCHYDAETGQTRHFSLGTIDFEEAKQKLTDWYVLDHQKKQQPNSEVLLSELFARYYDKHASTLISHATVRGYLNHWLDFYGTATLQEAADLTKQEAFRSWLIDEKGLSLSTVLKVLKNGKAAVNWAYKRSEIAQIPYFELVKVPDPEPKGRALEIEETACLLQHAEHHHLRLFILMLIGTLARPQAIFELEFSQIDFKRRIIELNPKGRTQTQKVRPTVKLPETLAPILLKEKSKNIHQRVITFNGEPVKNLKRSWGQMRTKSGLKGNVHPYSIRHTMARWLREQSVPAWEVAEQLGHRGNGYRVTEIYTSHSPDYLEQAVKAIDAYFLRLTCELRVNAIDELSTQKP